MRPGTQPNGRVTYSPSWDQPQHFTDWPIERLDAPCYAADSVYVETFWLPSLGPSSTWLLRKLAAGLQGRDELTVLMSDLARHIGLSPTLSVNGPVVKTMKRLERLKMIRAIGPSQWKVRCTLPGLPLASLAHLPPALQALHELWLATEGERG